VGPQVPAIWPESLIPFAPSTPSGARSVIVWPLQKTGSVYPALACAEPTTSPDRFIALPWLKLPPRVPRSVIVPLLHKNAW
jgi:hypothetical protein